MKPKIIIEVLGGVITEVRSNLNRDLGVEVEILDLDDMEAAGDRDRSYFEALAKEFSELPHRER